MDGGPSVPSAIPALELTRKRQTALSLLVKTEIFALNFYEHQCANIRFQGLPEASARQDVSVGVQFRTAFASHSWNAQLLASGSRSGPEDHRLLQLDRLGLRLQMGVGAGS